MKPVVCILTAFCLSFLAMNAASVSADTPRSCVFVAETGHNIHGVFSTYYLVHNGYENFGAPITEAFMENGLVVQYFQRARFEFRPEYPEPYRVQLGLLGLLYGITDPPVQSLVIPRADNPNYAYFPATGLWVPLTLKKYFDAHGGWELLGYPISNIRYEGKYFTQYFQRARLEWYFPENRVIASAVGQMALDKNYAADFKWRQRTASDSCTTSLPATLNVAGSAVPTPARLSVALPTPVPAGAMINVDVRVQFRQAPRGTQYVDIAVYDQGSHPLSGAALVATVRSANGDRVFPLLATDAAGRASFGFDVGDLPVNTPIWVYVAAQSGAVTSTGRDSFTR